MDAPDRDDRSLKLFCAAHIGAEYRDECRMELQIVNLRVAGSNPAEVSYYFARAATPGLACSMTS